MLLMLGKAFSKVETLSSVEPHGELAQVPQLIFGATTGSQQKIIQVLFLQRCQVCQLIRLVTLLILCNGFGKIPFLIGIFLSLRQL